MDNDLAGVVTTVVDIFECDPEKRSWLKGVRRLPGRPQNQFRLEMDVGETDVFVFTEYFHFEIARKDGWYKGKLILYIRRYANRETIKSICLRRFLDERNEILAQRQSYRRNKKKSRR